jgi:hypothetical protein
MRRSGGSIAQVHGRTGMSNPTSPFLGTLPLTSNLHNPEIPGKEEEHRQLPPDENVPQGRRPAQEGRCFGLNVDYGRIVLGIASGA